MVNQPLLLVYKKHARSARRRALMLCKLRADRLEAQIDIFMARLPVLPHDGVVWVARMIPYVAMVVLLVQAITLVGLTGGFLLYMFTFQWGALLLGVRCIALIVVCACLWSAIPALFKLHHRGWKNLYYGLLALNIAVLLRGDLLQALVLFLVGMYVVFQVRSVYHR